MDDDSVDKLSPMQQAFIEQYAICQNATTAAVRAGYNPRSARSQGSRLLSKPAIAAALATRVEVAARRVAIDAETVLAGLLTEATDRESKGSTAAARVQAWVALGKHLGLFVDKTEISTDIGTLQRIQRTIVKAGASDAAFATIDTAADLSGNGYGNGDDANEKS